MSLLSAVLGAAAVLFVAFYQARKTHERERKAKLAEVYADFLRCVEAENDAPRNPDVLRTTEAHALVDLMGSRRTAGEADYVFGTSPDEMDRIYAIEAFKCSARIDIAIGLFDRIKAKRLYLERLREDNKRFGEESPKIAWYRTPWRWLQFWVLA
ncbi:hypothetical protein D9V41_11510 [Aeromicrobium phragmitis]|uniref:DUF4760 domain-containing protein n=1 Tax=Aeromicrobium phragmitis TaxID=2478914 RepID=A0A3L8PJ61_9ACTN|nr:hypothetical protein D9V41_11510 [Aeromicrobium phragmitis]